MSDVDVAQTGAAAAPAQNSDNVPNPQVESSKPASEQVEQAATEEQPRDEAGRFIPKERFNQVYRESKENQRRAYAAEQEAARLRQYVEQTQRQAQAQAPLPNPEDFDYDWTKYGSALAETVRSQAIAEAEARIQQTYQQQSFQEQVRTFKAREEAYAAQHPEYLDNVATLQASVDLTDVMAEVISVSDHGPAIADYLAQNLEEADLISRLPPAQAAARIGRIEAKVSTPKPKPVTQAPAPVPALNGGSNVTKDPGRMTDAEWYAHERARERGK